MVCLKAGNLELAAEIARALAGMNPRYLGHFFGGPYPQ
jgi:hypothetical protein